MLKPAATALKKIEPGRCACSEPASLRCQWCLKGLCSVCALKHDCRESGNTYRATEAGKPAAGFIGNDFPG